MQKIHLAVAKQIKLIDQNITGANSILKRSKEQRSLCIDQILENATLWGGFIKDISLFWEVSIGISLHLSISTEISALKK